jgi:hypothetical protein
MLSLRQLLTPVAEADALTFCLEVLDGFGFQATSWQSNSAARTLVQLVARVASDVTYTIADIAAGGYAGLAKGVYADLVGKHQFNITRVPAAPAVGIMTLTSSPAAPPYVFSQGELVIGDGPSNGGGNSYSVDSLYSSPSTDPITLNPGTSIVFNVTSTIPGAAGNNLSANSTTLELWTPLVGVTVSNPPSPPITTAGSWLITPGADAESDGPGGRYNARMLARWDRLSYGSEGSYKAWALEALPALTRVTVREDTVPYGVRITGATAVGGLDAGQITTIRNYLYGITDGIGRRLLNDAVVVASANQVTTPALEVTAFVRSPFSADAVLRITTALTALFGTLPIGGKTVGGGPGKVLLADLYQTVMAQQGVQNVTFNLSADIVLGQDDIYEPIPTVTMVIVS